MSLYVCFLSSHLSFCTCLSVPFLSFTLIYSSNDLAQDLGSQRPLQATVVLLNSNGKSSVSQGVTMTTLCLDSPTKPKNRTLFGTEWLSLLKPSVKLKPDGGSLKFSKSLNDVGEKMDSLCNGLHFIDRTCSDGDLGVEKEEVLQDGHIKALNVKANSHPPFAFQPPSFLNNYKYISNPGPEHCLAPPAPPQSDLQRSSNFLRLIFPFTRSSTAGSLQASEMGSYASRLHIAKSSSTMLDVSESCCMEEMGDDEVFEEVSSRWKLKGLRAPLCSLEEDSDLDQCRSPLSEKNVPLSPFSLSGDCCRLVGLTHSCSPIGSTSRVIHPHSPTTAHTWIFISYQSPFILPVRGLLVRQWFLVLF
uniref:Uncharacterized protein n=2 Tax=Cyprinus carpio carpio TaxID=630221 RepID=A0A9J7YK39_CYPCA